MQHELVLIGSIFIICTMGCDGAPSSNADADGGDNSEAADTGDDVTPSSDEGDDTGDNDRDSDSDSMSVNLQNTEPLMPHAVGNTWTYRYEVLDSSSDAIPCDSGEWNAALTGMEVVDGLNVYAYLNPCAVNGEQASIDFTFNGDLGVVIEIGGIETYYIMLDTPVEEGHTWTTESPSGSFTYRWTEIGTVTVEAGTFDDCWDRVNDATDDHLVYCRGVGRVMGNSGDVYRSELISYQLASTK